MTGVHRIFITGPSIAEQARRLLDAEGCRYGFGREGDGPAELAAGVAELQADGLIVRTGVVDASVLRASSNLRALSKHGVGVDNIDVDAATALGIPVMRTPEANFESVAEHAVALMYALARQIPRQDALTRAGTWPRNDFRGHELAGRTLGIVGFGRIGRRVAELVAPLRMDVRVFDPFWKPDRIPDDITRVDDLNELLAAADIVTLHCPLTPETQTLIGVQEFARMKPGAWLINTARGPLVDGAALAAALREGRLAGAGLDTFAREPAGADEPLFALDNVIVTSRVAGFSDRSFRNMGVGAVQNVLCVLGGGRPDAACLVNPDVYAAASE